MPEPRVLEITKDNWRKTGITTSGFPAGKGDRIPATGQNLEVYRRNYDAIDWHQDLSDLRDPTLPLPGKCPACKGTPCFCPP